MNFVKFLRTPFFYRTPLVTASVRIDYIVEVSNGDVWDQINLIFGTQNLVNSTQEINRFFKNDKEMEINFLFCRNCNMLVLFTKMCLIFI